MAPRHDATASAGADRADETTASREVSSAGQAPSTAPRPHDGSSLPADAFAGDEQGGGGETRPDPEVPAGEPEAPAGPSRPHGDELEEALPEKGPAEPAPEGPEQTAHDQESKVQRDLDELTAKAQKADEYLELAQRTKADFENYRKRTAREAALAQDRGIAKLAKELLPAVDNLDRALQAAEAAGDGDEAGETLASGIRLVHADVIAALGRVGIEGYDPAGEQFDPQHHEAVAQQPVDGTPAGTIVEVYQRGYRLGDFVLRPARVVVAA